MRRASFRRSARGGYQWGRLKVRVGNRVGLGAGLGAGLGFGVGGGVGGYKKSRGPFGGTAAWGSSILQWATG